MREAMISAEVGDEQKGEDPTTRQLEESVAQLFGCSNAMFFPSATMANEVAICALCEPGDEIIAAADAHIFVAESGGPSIHAKVMCKPVPTVTGVFNSDDVISRIRMDTSTHRSKTKLISVENTTNFGGGVAWKSTELQSIVNVADQYGLKLHMDGSRIFNASIKTAMSIAEIARGFDTITVCLTKGLGCPVGALLVYKKQSHDTIRHLKHLMGGAMLCGKVAYWLQLVFMH